LGTKPVAETNWKTFGAGIGRRDSQLVAPTPMPVLKKQASEVSAVKCLEDHCKIEGDHNHSKIISQYIKSLGEGEGINYKMTFKEEDNCKYLEKHLKGCNEAVSEEVDGQKICKWYK